MTVGKDVSSLFPDVVNCMQTDSLELKKLVYLYLMNYAKSQPDLAILAVNTFAKVHNIIVSMVHLQSVLCLSLFRTVRTVIHSFVHWLCVPWAAYEWTRSQSICVSLYASASRLDNAHRLSNPYVTTYKHISHVFALFFFIGVNLLATV